MFLQAIKVNFPKIDFSIEIEKPNIEFYLHILTISQYFKILLDSQNFSYLFVNHSFLFLFSLYNKKDKVKKEKKSNSNPDFIHQTYEDIQKFWVNKDHFDKFLKFSQDSSFNIELMNKNKFVCSLYQLFAFEKIKEQSQLLFQKALQEIHIKHNDYKNLFCSEKNQTYRLQYKDLVIDNIKKINLIDRKSNINLEISSIIAVARKIILLSLIMVSLSCQNFYHYHLSLLGQIILFQMNSLKFSIYGSSKSVFFSLYHNKKKENLTLPLHLFQCFYEFAFDNFDLNNLIKKKSNNFKDSNGNCYIIVNKIEQFNSTIFNNYMIQNLFNNVFLKIHETMQIILNDITIYPKINSYVLRNAISLELQNILEVEILEIFKQIISSEKK